MSISLGPKLGLLYNSNLAENYTDSFRIFLQSLDQIIQSSVIGFSVTGVPPVSPNGGDAYYVPVSPAPSGAWGGHGGQVAFFNTQLTQSGTNNVVPGWIFVTPLNGWTVWNTSLQGLFVFNSGTWSNITAGVVQPVASYADEISTGTVSATVNVVKTWAFNLAQQATFTSISYSVQTADTSGSDFYSLGIFNNSGVLLASTASTAGSSFSPSTGYQNQNLIGQTVLPAGNYFLAFTGTSATAALFTAPSQFLGTSNHNSGASTAGAMPSSISIPPTSWSIDTTRPAISLH